MGHLKPSKPVISGFLLIATLMTPASTQGAQQLVELRGVLGEVSFDLPGPWERWEEGPASPHEVILRRVGRLHLVDAHVILVRVSVRNVPPTIRGLSPADHANIFLSGVEQSLVSRTDWKYEGFKRGERNAGHAVYPSLAYQATAANVLGDGLIALYYPPDFAMRERFYYIEWIDSRGPGEQPWPLAELDSLLASFRVRPLGAVILSDDFEDEAAGILPSSSPNESLYRVGYIDGEYSIQRVQTETDTSPAAFPQGVYGNVAISVDARVTGEEQRGGIELYCRWFRPSISGYVLLVDGRSGRFRLIRFDSEEIVALVNWRPSSAILPAVEWNSVELVCAGTTLAVDINGIVVASVEDSTYAEGNVGIGVGAPTGGSPEARFDNLLVVQR